MDIIKKNIEAYDKTAKQYQDYIKEFKPIELIPRQDFMSLVKGKILDLCCGSGRDSKLFTEKGYAVVGVDLSTEMIDIAKKNVPDASFKVMDALHLDFRLNSFDAVFFNAGLLAIPKKYALDMLKKVNSILIDSGILYISVKEGTGEGFQMHKYYKVEKFYAYYEKEEMEKLLKETGFEVLKFYRPTPPRKEHMGILIGFLCRKV